MRLHKLTRRWRNLQEHRKRPALNFTNEILLAANSVKTISTQPHQRLSVLRHGTRWRMRRLNLAYANDEHPEQLVRFANSALREIGLKKRVMRDGNVFRVRVPTPPPPPDHVIDLDHIDPVHIDPADPTHLFDIQQRVAACSCVHDVLVRHNATSFDRKVRTDVLRDEAAEAYIQRFGGHVMGGLNLFEDAAFNEVIGSALVMMNSVIDVGDRQYVNLPMEGVFHVWFG